MSEATEHNKKVISAYMAQLGKKGGARSKGGGRPRIPDSELTPSQRLRRERYEKTKQKQMSAKLDAE